MRQGELRLSSAFVLAEGEERQPDTLAFGIEVELEARKGHTASQIMAAVEKYPIFGWKPDGSLSAQGVECVTRPLTWKYIQTSFPFEELFGALHPIAESFDPAGHYNAGIHIHVSGAAFSNEHLFRFLKLHYQNKAMVVRMGGRDTSMMKFTINDQRSPPTDAVLQAYAAARRNSDRYTCVNVNIAHDTAELRYFRSTTNELRFRAYLEWVYACYTFSKNYKTMTEDMMRRYLERKADVYPHALSLFNGEAEYDWERSTVSVPVGGRRYYWEV
jgi:hypothetical protein